MLNADRALRMATCPRCGFASYERLKSHGHCVDCNYADLPYSDETLTNPLWAIDVSRRSRTRKVKQQRYARACQLDGNSPDQIQTCHVEREQTRVHAGIKLNQTKKGT